MRFIMANLSSLFSLLLALILIPTSCCGELPDDHVALFVFGDSLYDVGNNFYNTHSPPQSNLPPYGETFLPYPTGRNSDGRLVPDFISQHANLSLIPPYLQGDTNYTNGANFASAGAGVLDETDQEGAINLNSQLDYFKTAVEKLKEQLGEEDAQKLLSNAVYLFSIGGNDILSLIRNEPQLPPTFYDFRYMLTVLGNFTAVIQQVYNEGGRKFGIQNVGPMGCNPGNRVSPPGNTSADNEECAEKPQRLSKLYNSYISKLLERFSTQLPDFQYSLFDYYNSLMERVLDYTKFGFLVGDTACCGSGPYKGNFTCGHEGDYSLCSNPCTYVWFDAAHPTERTNMQIAKLFWSGDDSVTWPTNLSTLFKTSSRTRRHSLARMLLPSPSIDL